MRLALILTVASAGFCASAQNIADTIVYSDGRRDRGVEVLETTSTEIKYKRGDEEATAPASSVHSIEWSSPPEALSLARAADRRGEYTTAANLYVEAGRQSARKPFKADVEYLAARATVRAAGKDQSIAGDAVTQLEAWKSNYGDNWRLPDVMFQLARAQRYGGDGSAAEATLEALERTVLEKSLQPTWTPRARLEKARALLSQNRIGEARSAFRSAGTSVSQLESQNSDEARRMAIQAVVGEGETFIQSGDFAAALRFFRSGVKADTPAAVRAALLAGEGQALYLQSEAAGNQEGLRRAQIALAEANLTDTLSGDTTAKALFYAAKTLLSLGAAGRETDDFQERALSNYETITTHYSDTTWAVRAAAELKSR